MTVRKLLFVVIEADGDPLARIRKPVYGRSAAGPELGIVPGFTVESAVRSGEKTELDEITTPSGSF
jgi:hypothetical protein